MTEVRAHHAVPGRQGALENLGILVTRPAHQAESLVRRLQEEGGRVIRFPVLAIADIEDPRPVLAAIDRLHAFHMVIFVSANAVERGMRFVRRRGELPPHLRLVVVGKGTAKALARLGLRSAKEPVQLPGRSWPVIQPQPPYNTEALLAMSELQPAAIAGHRILIFRGVGGRELLAQALRRRGAEVEYAEVYRRIKPSMDALTQWQPDAVDVVLVTSGEGLKNLFAMVAEMAGPQGLEFLRTTPLVVVGERMAAFARELGVMQPPIVAAGASDEDMVHALRRWRG